jgi:hypothetical protein
MVFVLPLYLVSGNMYSLEGISIESLSILNLTLTIFPFQICFQVIICIDVQCLFFSLIYVQSRK